MNLIYKQGLPKNKYYVYFLNNVEIMLKLRKTMCSRQTGCYLVSFNHFKRQLVNVLETISERK